MWRKIKLEKELRHIQSIQVFIEQKFDIEIAHISKWFSVEHIPTEVIKEESKITVRNGSVMKYENTSYHPFTRQYIYDYELMVRTEIDWQKRITTNPIQVDSKKTGIICGNFQGLDFRVYYNNDGLCVKEETLEKNGQLIKTRYRQYDNRGLCIKIYTVKDKTTVIDSIYEYNINGEQTYAEYIDDFGIKKQHITRYNEFNDIVFDDGYCNNKRFIKTFEYVYDKYNNWTERKELSGNKLIGVTKRQFKYI